ncbi:MAG: UDP-glucose 4-epimerase GalE [Phycisphaerales bacterium]|jgi:UDP-glucose 4-epimerase|nr:UDP-glucose 4-epimerase GalE [Phycisphaerales bacterium]
MNVLVSGGAGYIGSHACLSLLGAGHRVTIVDNLDLGHLGAVRALESVAGDRVRFERCDILEGSRLEALMREESIEVVMHFAALANVGDSVVEPLTYYRNNTAGAISLLEACRAAGVERFVFSSTCATYGEPEPDRIPISEDCPQDPVNPYGRSKLMVEQVLADEARSAQDAGRNFAFAALRYFNVAGADPENRLGEDHVPETHLLPICLQVALGKRETIGIFGTDYPTPDGTCIRDYVHVTDLVNAHLMVMDALQPGDQRHYNIGIGRGYSVRECIDACRRVTGHPIPETAGPRRPGDPPELTADASHIRQDLGFEARFTDLDEIIRTAWTWFKSHPEGYED